MLLLCGLVQYNNTIMSLGLYETTPSEIDNYEYKLFMEAIIVYY